MLRFGLNYRARGNFNEKRNESPGVNEQSFQPVNGETEFERSNYQPDDSVPRYGPRLHRRYRLT